MNKLPDAQKEIQPLLEEISSLVQRNKGFGFWHYLKKAEKICSALKKKTAGKIEKNVVIKGNVFVSKGAIIKSGSRIEGNVFLGEGTVVGPNAFLRGFVITGKNCFIGMSEVKSSVFLDHSRAPHFNYVGDSILGENVNLGAGTKIANLRHDYKNVQVEIEGNKVDSGQRKLGAVIGSNVKTGINASINCGCIVQNNTKIMPGEFYQK